MVNKEALLWARSAFALSMGGLVWVRWAGLGDYGRLALKGCAWGWVVLLKNVGCSSQWA